MKMSERHTKRHLILVVIGLVLFAAAASSARLLLHKSGGFPAGDRTWSVTFIAHVNVPEKDAQIGIAPPWDTRYARLYGQALLHPGMRQLRSKAGKRNRDIVLLATRAGELMVEVYYDLHISQSPRPEPKRPALAEDDRAAWLGSSPGIPVELPLAATILDALTRDKPDTAILVDRLFEHVSERVRISTRGGHDGGEALQQHQGSALGANRAMVTLLRAAHLPARMVTGLDLSLTADKQPVYWAEVYYHGRWHPVDVAGGHLGELPPDSVPLRKGSEFLLETENARLIKSYWRIQPATPPQGLLVTGTPEIFHVLDLTRLAPGTREMLAKLLLLPLGALATQFMRHMVGIRTYGTFTPTLLALAVVFVDWFTALVTFTLVTVLGIAGRAMLPDLGLSRVPRLSIVYTMVAMLMAMVVSLLTHVDPSIDSAVVLLPVVILTMLVDRIYAVADERGLRIALLRLGWTVAAALLSLVILLQTYWGSWFLAYPEMHAITIALIILLGQYKGKGLTDLPGLRWLREPVRKPPPTPPSAPDQVSGQTGGSR